MGKLTISLLLFTCAVICLHISEVHSKKGKMGKDMADDVMKNWNKFVKSARGEPKSYKYWHYRQDANGKWHKRKYGHSDSSESVSSSSSSESKSKSREHHRDRYRSDSRSRESVSDSTEVGNRHGGSEKGSKLPAKLVGEVHTSGGDEMPLVAHAFTFFIDNYGCKNVTAFQEFMASYNMEAKDDELITLNGENDVLMEMSKMAQEELDNQKGGKAPTGEEQCSKTCP